MTESGTDGNIGALSDRQAEQIDASGPGGVPWSLARRNLALSLLIASIIWPHLLFFLDFSGFSLGPLDFAVDLSSWLVLLLPMAAIVVWRKIWPVVLVFFLGSVFMLYGHYFSESVYLDRDGLLQMGIFDFKQIMKLALTHGCDDGNSNYLEVCSLATFMADAFGYYFRALRLAVVPALLLSFGLWRLDGRGNRRLPRLPEVRAFFRPLTPGKLLYAVLGVIAVAVVMSPYFLYLD